MYKRFSILLLFLMPILLVACGREPEIPASFQVSSMKSDVDIRSVPGDNLVTFHIYSPSGIGDATVQLVEGDMPDTVRVRLYVENLDNLELSYDDLTIIATAKRDAPVHETLKMQGGEATIFPDNLYWMDILPLPAEEGGKFFGKPAQPPSYLIILPKDFHAGGHTRFSLRWIDYYR